MESFHFEKITVPLFLYHLNPFFQLFSKEKSKLNLVKCNSTSIPPRSVYHPIVVNVCKAMFSKHPKNLTPEEVAKFNIYKERKKQIGEPLESEVIYLPTGGIRTCVNCGELT